MTYPAQPARAGMPSWAKWTLFGCGGCLLVVVLSLGGCMAAFWQMFGKNMKMYDVSGKPDAPLTATANQLIPPRVGPFTRQRVTRTPQKVRGSTVNAWQGVYTSRDRKRVELSVSPTGEMQQARRAPLGQQMPRSSSTNPNMGFRMSIDVGGQKMEMVVWSKPNWTYTVQSPDLVAVKFADAYRPTVGK